MSSAELPPRPRATVESDGVGESDSKEAGADGEEGGHMGQDAACVASSCRWLATDAKGCKSARLPSEDARPAEPQVLDAPDMAFPALPAFYLAYTRLWLGESLVSGEPDAEAWRTWGFDQDEQCTRSATCEASKSGAESCKRRTAVARPDANFCADNAFSELQSIAAGVMNLGPALGLREQDINCALHHGEYNQLLRISDYNGQSNDPHVRVDVYASPGLEKLNTSWACPQEDYENAHPRWLPSQTWLVDDKSLSEQATTPTGLANATLADPDAFVSDGYLIAHLADGFLFTLAGKRSNYPGSEFAMGETTILGKLEQDDSQVWHLRDGMLVSRQKLTDVLAGYHKLGVCPTGEYATVYPIIEDYLSTSADLTFSGERDGALDCDAISTTYLFSATMADVGTVITTEPLLDCCQEDNRGEGQCPQITCGDGEVGEDERCDIAIPAGEPGACPDACPNQDPCQRQQLQGDQCQRSCVTTPVTAPRDDDGCCPEEGNATNDTDCESRCGNGVLEEDESCEPGTLACPAADSCQSYHSCLSASFTGSAEACTARCELTDITSCIDDDGCCAPSCSADTDNDCSATCGDGVVDALETCDGDCPSECGSAGATGMCAAPLLVGSAARCTAQCLSKDGDTCRNDDGCCPDGCHAVNDSDCSPRCGNSVREGDEQCDDGNQAPGDGCDPACRTETAAQSCLALNATAGSAALNEACAQCACEACPMPLQRCLFSEDPVQNQHCSAVLICKTRSGCFGDTCVGAAPFSLPGPCRSEVLAASGGVDLADAAGLLAAELDINTALGRANDLRWCMSDLCPAVCTTPN